MRKSIRKRKAGRRTAYTLLKERKKKERRKKERKKREKKERKKSEEEDDDFGKWHVNKNPSCIFLTSISICYLELNKKVKVSILTQKAARLLLIDATHCQCQTGKVKHINKFTEI